MSASAFSSFSPRTYPVLLCIMLTKPRISSSVPFTMLLVISGNALFMTCAWRLSLALIPNIAIKIGDNDRWRRSCSSVRLAVACGESVSLRSAWPNFPGIFIAIFG